MREYHRIHQPDPSGKPRRAEMRRRVENANDKEQQTQRLLVHAEALKEPIRQERIGQESTAAGIERKERRNVAHDSPGLRRDVLLCRSERSLL